MGIANQRYFSWHHVDCVKYYIVLWNRNSHFVSSITSSIKSSKQMQQQEAYVDLPLAG